MFAHTVEGDVEQFIDRSKRRRLHKAYVVCAWTSRPVGAFVPVSTVVAVVSVSGYLMKQEPCLYCFVTFPGY